MPRSRPISDHSMVLFAAGAVRKGCILETEDSADGAPEFPLQSDSIKHSGELHSCGQAHKHRMWPVQMILLSFADLVCQCGPTIEEWWSNV